METYLPPNRRLSLKKMTVLPNNNQNADNFGGWLIAQMHLAGENVAGFKAKGRVVTSSINDLSFYKPIFVGDELSCYAEVIRISRSTLTLNVEAWVHRSRQEEDVKVTEGIFTFIAIDDKHEPRALSKD